MRYIYALIFILFSFALTSCEKEEGGGNKGPAKRTVLVYIMADNDLNSEANDNVKAMAAGMKLSQNEGNLIIYQDIQGSKPKLIKVESNGTLTTLAEYGAENSASPEVLSRVVNETLRRYPAESYGLVLSSHGYAWIPKTVSLSGPKAEAATYRRQFPNAPMTKRTAEEVSETGNLQSPEESPEHPAYREPFGSAIGPKTKWFGQDASANSYLNISELVATLPGDRFFDFILFDACFMSSIEALYDLRNTAEYIISSPAEVLAEGFPYERIVPQFFEPELPLMKICSSFMSFYEEYVYKSATISLVKTSELEALAQTVRPIVAPYVGTWVNLDGIQAMESMSNHLFFDLGDYLARLNNSDLYNQFVQQLDRTVVYKAHTSVVYSGYGGWFNVLSFSGVTSYIPRRYYTDYNTAYRQTEWAKAIGY